jgi:hypothetical protein
MRVLVTVSPQMYRQAIAHSIQSACPGIEVRIAPPEDAEEQLRLFRPDLLLYNDTAPIPEEALERVPARVEMLYSDSTQIAWTLEFGRTGWSPRCATCQQKTSSERWPWRRP